MSLSSIHALRKKLHVNTENNVSFLISELPTSVENESGLCIKSGLINKPLDRAAC